MPASFQIDASTHLVRSVLQGRITNDDLIAHERRLQADAAFDSDLDQYIDTSGVTEVAIDADGIRVIARMQFFGPRSRRAIVTTDNTIYGLARMFEILRATAPETIRVFRDADEAWAWLHGPPPRPRTSHTAETPAPNRLPSDAGRFDRVVRHR